MLDQPLLLLFIGFLLVSVAAWFIWPKHGWIDRRRLRQRQSLRILTEDALKTLVKAEIDGRESSVTVLSGIMQVDQDTGAVVLKDMEMNGLVRWTDDRPELTPEGREYGLHMLRAHRLLERQLADRTGHSETEWHTLADLHEHKLTREQVDALSSDLGNPIRDPHGDPIPAADGSIKPHGGKPLTRFEGGDRLVIVHIEDEPEAVYAQLVAEGLSPGMEVHVLSKKPERISFWSDGEEHILAPILANNISVTPIPEEEASEPYEAERLSDLRPGESARVIHIAHALRGPARRRLLDLGLTPGTIVEAELQAMGGDPTGYRIRGAIIALRKEQAQRVQVTRATEDAATD
jgi:DtxR family transcriptional regulator, Mn-dependent transcriptional regulator